MRQNQLSLHITMSNVYCMVFNNVTLHCSNRGDFQVSIKQTQVLYPKTRGERDGKRTTVAIEALEKKRNG